MANSDQTQSLFSPDFKSALTYLAAATYNFSDGHGNHVQYYPKNNPYYLTPEQLKKEPTDANFLRLTKEILDGAGVKTNEFSGTGLITDENCRQIIIQVQKKYNREFSRTPGFVALEPNGELNWYTKNAIARAGQFISDQVDKKPNVEIMPGPLLGGVSQQDIDQKLFPAAYNSLSGEARDGIINRIVPLLAGDERAINLIKGPQVDRDLAREYLINQDGRHLSVKPDGMSEGVWKAETFKILVKSYQQSHNKYFQNPDEPPLPETGVPDQRTLAALGKDYAHYDSSAAPVVTQKEPVPPVASPSAKQQVKGDASTPNRRELKNTSPIVRVDYKPDVAMQIGKGAPPEQAKFVQEVILKWKPDADIGSNQKTADGKHVAPDNIFKDHTEARVIEMQKEINKTLAPNQRIREDGVIDKRAAIAMMQKAGMEIPANLNSAPASVADPKAAAPVSLSSASPGEGGTFAGNSYFQQSSTMARNYGSLRLTDTNFLNTPLPAIPLAPINLALTDKAPGTGLPGMKSPAVSGEILTQKIDGKNPFKNRQPGPGGFG